MGIALMFLLALYQMQSAIHSEIIETPNYGDNALEGAHSEEPISNNNEPHPVESELLDALSEASPEQTELEFRYPISAIGIDYAKNSVVLRFQKHARKPRYKYDPDYQLKRTTLKDNFMHFGKRQAEQMPQEIGNGLYETVKRSAMDRYGRDPKQDFMRFGRSSTDYMRFGRNPKQDFMRFGRSPKEDFMRFGRDPKQDFMRFGRSPKEDFMRFGRDPKQDFMRFGRDPKQDFMRFGRDPKQDFMRFGRDPKQDFMRFGRADNFMRFGRNMNLQEELRSPKQDFMRFGRPDNFMRFGRSTPTEFERSGKLDANFMRFGKSVQGTEASTGSEGGATNSESNQTKTDDGKQQPSEESNPTDKAITRIFSKEQSGQQKSSELSDAQNGQDESSVEQLFEP